MSAWKYYNVPSICKLVRFIAYRFVSLHHSNKSSDLTSMYQITRNHTISHALVISYTLICTLRVRQKGVRWKWTKNNLTILWKRPIDRGEHFPLHHCIGVCIRVSTRTRVSVPIIWRRREISFLPRGQIMKLILITLYQHIFPGLSSSLSNSLALWDISFTYEPWIFLVPVYCAKAFFLCATYSLPWTAITYFLIHNGSVQRS